MELTNKCFAPLVFSGVQLLNGRNFIYEYAPFFFKCSRDSHDHEATAMVKAQFMQMWDGLETSIDATVVVMGATNRPKDVDKAILRRMPATFHIGLPDIHQRKRYDLLKFIF